MLHARLSSILERSLWLTSGKSLPFVRTSLRQTFAEIICENVEQKDRHRLCDSTARPNKPRRGQVGAWYIRMDRHGKLVITRKLHAACYGVQSARLGGFLGIHRQRVCSVSKFIRVHACASVE